MRRFRPLFALAVVVALVSTIVVLRRAGGTHAEFASGPPRSGTRPALPGARPSEDPWRDRDLILRQWHWAGEAVSWICDTEEVEATHLQVCTTEEYTEAKLWSRISDRRPEARPRTVEALDAERERVRAGVSFEIAFFDEHVGTVFVYPEGLEDCLEHNENDVDAGLNVLRLVLVHEATHALDHKRFPTLFRDPNEEPGHERDSQYALLEGHAWFVSEAVAKAYGWTRARLDLHALVSLSDVVDSPEAVEAVWKGRLESGDADALGRRVFLEADASGGRPLVDFLLSYPPEGHFPDWTSWEDWLRARTASHRAITSRR